MNPETNKKFYQNTGQVGGAVTDTGIISQDGVTPITSESLQPATPLNIPTPTPVNSADALIGVASAVKDSTIANAKAQLEADKLAKEQALEASKNDLGSIRDEILGVQETRSQAETDAKLGEKSQRVTDVTNQLEAEQRALVNELRALEGSGLTDSQKAVAIREINRRSAFTQADLSLIQSAANRDLATAQSIVDRKINLALEPLKTKLDFAKTFYEENKDSFNTVDDRSFKNLVTESEREYQKEKDKVESFENLRLKFIDKGIGTLNSQSLASIANAKDEEALFEAVAKAGLSVGASVEEQLYSGLKPATATAVRGQVTSFKNEPTVKNFSTVQEGYNFAQSLADNTTNPADDQALVYQFAKVMDPDSVVREGEYATVQKYSQSWAKAYGKGIENAIAGTGFLSEEARKNIKATLKSRYESRKSAYESLRKNYSKGINNLTGRQDGEKFVTDYSMEYGQSNDPLQIGVSVEVANPLGI